MKENLLINQSLLLLVLKEIYICDSVEEIEENAFKDCKALSDIYFEGTEDQWLDLKESGWLSAISMNVNVVLNAPK